MKPLIFFGTFALAAFLISSCYYDNEETLYPGSLNCTPNPDPSYTNDVKPILDNRCNNCHSGTAPSGGIDLSTYAQVKVYVVNGKLMGSITYAKGYSPMPKNGSKLSNCQIQLIQDWIDLGALNN
jgi:hypothetical protein